MYLVYLDESGNTGTNLRDAQQPIFVLCAMAVPINKWLQLERDLLVAVEKLYPSPRSDDFEIHATVLMSGRAYSTGVTLTDRLALRDAWFSLAVKHGLKIIYRAIEKKRFEQWVHQTFGAGVAINPHVAAFPLVARVVDDWLRSLTGAPLGIFISDDNKEIVRDVEKSVRLLRVNEGTLRLNQIVEKCFFIDSRKSIVLQLCDLCALTLRKKEEAILGVRDNPIYHTGIELLEPLIHRGDEALLDVLDWFAKEEKKKRPGTSS